MINPINLQPTTATSGTTTQPLQTIHERSTPSIMNDKISMSDTTQLVMQIINDTQATVSSERITQLQQAIQQGTYLVNADQVAARLMRDMNEL